MGKQIFNLFKIWGNLVIGLVTAYNVIREEVLSSEIRESWRLGSIIESWSWQSWIIVFLISLIATFVIDTLLKNAENKKVVNSYLGQGGKGGNAKVTGSGTAIGGQGGGAGVGGRGGDGGDAEVVGDGFAMGGEGGEAGQEDRGGRGGRSPFEVLGIPNEKLPDGTWLWDKGRGGDGGGPIQSEKISKNDSAS